MKINVKTKRDPKGIAFGDISNGSWTGSLEPQNTNKLLIIITDDICAVINFKAGSAEAVMNSEKIYNLTKVNIIDINLEEI